MVGTCNRVFRGSFPALLSGLMVMLCVALPAVATAKRTAKTRTPVPAHRAVAAHKIAATRPRGGTASRSKRAVANPVARGKRGVERIRGRKGRTRPAGVEKTVVATRLVRGRHGRLVRVAIHPAAPAHFAERFYASSFADGQTLGDSTAGEDPIVRAAAVEALGNMNGTALAIDPSTGRILAMVNQKLALSGGAEPCSTIKLSVALAALQEGLVTRDTPVNLGGGYRMTLTQALAHSNNLYFETLGRSLGFERVKHYANQLGLGELAGYNIPGEQLGVYPDQELPAALGGVGRMCSFGESVSMTPLQLGAIVSAIANGGTLLYLQHPATADDVAAFQPKIKRTLDIGNLVPEMQDGMLGATIFGTARRLRASFTEFPVMGKTGTCSNNGTRFGWFGSYANTPNGRIVTVIFLEGGRPTFGPKAAELTGVFYRALYDKNYFLPHSQTASAVEGGGSE